MRVLLPLSVVAFWGWMMALLVQREILPGLGQSAAMTYETALSGLEFPHEEKFTIEFLRSTIGEMTTRYEREGSGYRLSNRIACKFGSESSQRWGKWFPPGWDAFLQMKLDWTLHLDSRLRLSRLEASAATPTSRKMVVRGEVARDLLTLDYGVEGTSLKTERFDFSHDKLLAHGLGGVGFLKPLEPGKLWKTQTLDITSLVIGGRPQTKEVVYFVKERRREVLLKGSPPVDVYVIEVGARGIDGEIWAAPDGTVLRANHYGLVLTRQ